MPVASDPDRYTTVPTRSAGATLRLARALVSAATSRPNELQASRLARLCEGAELLHRAWADAGLAVTLADLRKLDEVLDRRWIALRGRLDSCLLLDDDDHALRAEALLRTLFPTGLDFLELPHREQWAQSEQRLVHIFADELDEELEALCGEPYLPLLLDAHVAYGDALGITDREGSPADITRVLEPLAALKDAIASYARSVLDTMNEDDPESLATAQRQLEPILRVRRSFGSRRAATEPSEPRSAVATASP